MYSHLLCSLPSFMTFHLMSFHGSLSFISFSCMCVQSFILFHYISHHVIPFIHFMYASTWFRSFVHMSSHFISFHFIPFHSLHLLHVASIVSFIVFIRSCIWFMPLLHFMHVMHMFVHSHIWLSCIYFARLFPWYIVLIYCNRPFTPFIHLLLLCCIDSCTTPKRLQLLWFCAVRLPNCL